MHVTVGAMSVRLRMHTNALVLLQLLVSAPRAALGLGCSTVGNEVGQQLSNGRATVNTIT